MSKNNKHVVYLEKMTMKITGNVFILVVHKKFLQTDRNMTKYAV